MYSGSSGRLGSERMPERASSVTRYWSITHSMAERLPRRYSYTSGGMPVRVREELTTTVDLSLLRRMRSTFQENGSAGLLMYLRGHRSRLSQSVCSAARV